MGEFESANTPEVAEPAELAGANETEVAELSEETVDEQEDVTEDTENNEPDEGEENADEQDSKTNAAFAEQRRRIAELEKELAERDEAQRLSEKEAEEQAELEEQIQAIVDYAREQGLTDDEIEEVLDEFADDYENKKELERRQEEIDKRDEEIVNLQLQQLAQKDLAELQSIDPNIKDLDSLGEEFFSLRSVGIDAKRAYYMIQQADEATKPHGAYAPGKISKARQERDYYTSEELDNLTKEEMHANWEKVQRSMDRL